MITIAVSLWSAAATYGWLELTVGPLWPIFWGLLLAWVACVTCVLRWRRRWWILITAPFVLHPVVLVAVLMFECARGNCL